MSYSEFPQAVNLIGGKAVAGPDVTSIMNPARRQQRVGSVASADIALVDAAVDAAWAAFPSWRSTPLEERQQLLMAAAERLTALLGEQDLAMLLTLEQGKILSEAKMDTEWSVGTIKGAVATANGLQEQVIENESGRAITVHEPIGVVAAVTPWNWPVLLSMMKIGPALISGNTVVLKPAPNTPLAISAMVHAMAEALPSGVLNVVHGGAEVGAHLVAHPKVGKVSFTGSIASGRKVYAACGATVKRLDMELGGNDPAIVLEDASLTDEMIRSIRDNAYITTGQVCIAVKRLYVPESRQAEFVEKFKAAVDEIVVGDGLDSSVTMGPLNNEMQFNKVRRMIDDAKNSGADVTVLGSRANNVEWEDGNFLQPSVVTNVSDDADVVREEQFGPVVPILTYTDVDDAVRRANDTYYGLSSSVWSSDMPRALEVASQLETGRTWINQHGVAALNFGVPTGGLKQSGLGLTHGLEGLYAYMNQRSIVTRSPAQPV